MAPTVLSRLRQEFTFLRGNLLLLIICYTIFHFSYSVHSPFRSPYIRELGASPFLIGLMTSAGSAILALIRIPGAHIADKYGRRRVIVLFTYGAALAYLIYALAPDWRFILLAIVVTSLSHVYQPALEAIEADSMPATKRGMAYSAINVLPRVTGLIAAPIGGLIVERRGLVAGMRAIYGLVFVLVVLIAVIRTLFLEETLERAERLRIRDLASTFRDSKRSLAEAWGMMSRDVRFYTLAAVIAYLEMPIYEVYMSLYAYDVVGVTGFKWGLMDVAWTITALLLGFPLGRMIDQVGRKRSILVSYILSIPVVAFFIFSRGFMQLLVVIVIFAASQAIMYPAFMALRADLIPQENRGRIMGLIGTLNTLAWIPAASVFGLMYQFNPAAPFVASIIIELMTITIVFFKIYEPTIH